MLFLWTDGEAHVILAGGDSFAKKSPGAMVCHCCGKNRQSVPQRFGGAEVAMASIEGRPRLLRDIPSERRILDYGAHGVLRVTHCAVNRTVSVLQATQVCRGPQWQNLCKTL